MDNRRVKIVETIGGRDTKVEEQLWYMNWSVIARTNSGASTIPRKKRTAIRLPKLVVAAVHADTSDHVIAAPGRYQEGRMRVISMLEGS